MNHVTGKENVLDFPEREIENKERSICVSGFFSIPNELADKLCSTRLSDQEHRVLFAVMRRTLGYRKLVDWVSLEQLHEMTGIKKPNLSKTIKTLLERRILIRKGRKLGINQTVSEWVDKVRTLSKQITKVMPIDNDCYADRQPNHEQKVMPMDNAVIQTDNNCYADRQPQKNTILQNTNIKDLSTNSSHRKKPKLFKAFFDAYPAHRKGGSDSHVWKVWKAERLTESDAKLALEWLQMAAHQSRDWELQSECPYVVGITRFVRERRWLTPLPTTQKRYSPPDFHSGDTSWAKDLGW